MKIPEHQFRKLFIRYLRKHNALIPFLLNIYRPYCSIYDNWEKITLSQALKSKKSHSWPFLFHWSKTTEGELYWGNIFRNWNALYMTTKLRYEQ